MSRVRVLALPLLAASLLIAACGGDDETETTDTPVTSAATDTTAAAAETTTAPETTEAAAVTTVAPATTAAPEPAPETTEAPEAALGSLVDVATAAGNFTTLLAAVEAAGLTETLATSKLTVLAPTDEAFAALGQPAIDALLADPALLTAVLQGHLLPLPQDAATISIFSSVITVAGTSLAVTDDGGVVTIGGATVTAADIPADNGFIHVIDTVILPAS